MTNCSRLVLTRSPAMYYTIFDRRQVPLTPVLAFESSGRKAVSRMARGKVTSAGSSCSLQGAEKRQHRKASKTAAGSALSQRPSRRQVARSRQHVFGCFHDTCCLLVRGG